MSRSPRGIVLIEKREWEEFLRTVERFVDLHIKLLQKLEELESKNAALKNELREVLASGTSAISQRVTSKVQAALRPAEGSVQAVCRYCGAWLSEGDKYCFKCGKPTYLWTRP